MMFVAHGVAGSASDDPIPASLSNQQDRLEIQLVVTPWAYGAATQRAISVLSPLILLGLWEVCARVHAIDTRFFPGPSSIFVVLGEMLKTGELLAHLNVSLQRIAIGFLIGAVPGVIVGISVGL